MFHRMLVAWSSLALPQTQLTCRTTVVSVLPSLVLFQSQHSHSPVGEAGLWVFWSRLVACPIWPRHLSVAATAWIHLICPSLIPNVNWHVLPVLQMSKLTQNTLTFWILHSPVIFLNLRSVSDIQKLNSALPKMHSG